MEPVTIFMFLAGLAGGFAVGKGPAWLKARAEAAKAKEQAVAAQVEKLKSAVEGGFHYGGGSPTGTSDSGAGTPKQVQK